MVLEHIYPNGIKYVGEFKNSQLEGKETINYPGGDKYVGEVSNRERNGQGAYTYPDCRTLTA